METIPETRQSGIRFEGRAPDALRPVVITRNLQKYAEGSVLIEVGDTRVLCSATVEERLPQWIRNRGLNHGWVTAEYSMLPRSTAERINRDRARGARSLEIQRLVGRALRAATDLAALGERQIMVDCDVLQADGGTRTAAITGAMVALADALAWLAHNGKIKTWPLKNRVAAVSVGLVKGQNLLDLDYLEDQAAEVDCNLVMTDDGRLVEIQGTAEGEPCPRDIWDALLELGTRGIGMMFEHQARAMVPALEAKKLFPLA